MALHDNHLGSESLTTDASGAKTSDLRYKPFGSVRTTWGSMPTKQTFTGQLDVGMGLLDFGGGTRMYSPTFGRFLSPDSIVPRPGDPQSFNRCAFVRNNPLSRVDPTGHADGIIGEIGGFFVGLAYGVIESNLPSPQQVAQAADALSVQESSFAVGRVAGNAGAIAQGLVEMAIGVGGYVGGAACVWRAACRHTSEGQRREHAELDTRRPSWAAPV